MKLYYHTTPRPGNMGDILNKWLVETIAQDSVVLARPGQDVYMCIGSIAKFAEKGMKVWGTGTMRMSDKLSKDAEWCAVRGPLTRQAVIQSGGECPEVYGDPALLMPYLYKPEIEKQHTIGIIPHYVDYQAVKSVYHGYKVINILDANPLAVIDQILKCEKIVSSSLHGLIIAQAYGIPAVLVDTIDGKLSGDGTKFLDYFYSTGQEPRLPVPMKDIENLKFSANLSFDPQPLYDACPFPNKHAIDFGDSIKKSNRRFSALNDMPVIVSFYTPDYAHHARRLEAECKTLGLAYEIVPHEPIGEWIDNTRIKGRIVLDAMNKHNKPVLWVDVDSSVHQKPHLFSYVKADFAAKTKQSGERPFSVGHLWFNNTKKGREFLEKWALECDNAPQGVSDEWAMCEAWKKVKGVKYIGLPDSYFAFKIDRDTVLSVRISGNASRYAGTK
jgi:hypothetical protein